LHAGVESSVAATKSVIAQMTAGARMVAAWQNDVALQGSLYSLPGVLSRAAGADWSAGVEALQDADRLLVIGRGLGLPVAQEAALKFKEVCGIQAEAFSGAEVRHGPIALVGEDYPVLMFAPRGPAQAGLLALADTLRARGARVLLAAPGGTPRTALPIAESSSADLDPVSMLQSFYPMVEALSRVRSLDPDRPMHLHKVTRTR
jgi:glucosamine--fructose-6-phosphate aminotransferase (isomerizing)